MTDALRTPSRKRKKPSAQWIEMLIDIILLLLSRQQQVWSSVVERCFQYIVPHLTKESFQLILKVINHTHTHTLYCSVCKIERSYCISLCGYIDWHEILMYFNATFFSMKTNVYHYISVCMFVYCIGIRTTVC